MSEVTDIEFEKDSSGNNFVRIDLNRYRNIINPILKQLGVIEKTEFDRDWERGMDPESFRIEAKKRLREIYIQKYSDGEQ